jgi:superfamily II DNA or RNA helicase
VAFKITNYDTVRRDLDLINAWSPDLVIADEAQRIKNWDTKAAEASIEHNLLGCSNASSHSPPG